MAALSTPCRVPWCLCHGIGPQTTLKNRWKGNQTIKPNHIEKKKKMHTLIIQTGGSRGENMNIHLHPMQIIKGSLRTWVWSQRLSQLNYTHSPQTLIHPVYPKCLWLAVGMGLQTRGDLRNTCTILDISAQGHRIRLAHPQTGARSWHRSGLSLTTRAFL